MRRKIAWLFVWTTLAFWLGCGQNQNYRINQEDENIFEAPEPSQPGGGSSSANWPDRSSWPVVELTPARGIVHHRPHYFDRASELGPVVLFTKDRPSPLLVDPQAPEDPFLRATSDDDFKIGWSAVGDLFVAPAKVAADVGTWPARAIVFDRPWSWRTSPPR